jgi:mannose-6-phosphate isomerase-like protein (cupin superfamily)
MHDPVISRASEKEEYFFEEGCFITESWNCSEDEACSIARARVPVGVTTRLHWLEGIEERYVIIEGEGSVLVGDAPAQPVGSGDVVVIPSGCRQSISNTGSGDLQFYAICTPRFRAEAYHGAS